MTIVLLVALLVTLFWIRACDKELVHERQRANDAWAQVEERNARIIRLEHQHDRLLGQVAQDNVVITSLRTELRKRHRKHLVGV